MASTIIAIAPIIYTFEDFFVNGIKLSDHLPFFIGAPSKQKILPVIEAYYGRMKKNTLSWEMILKMINDMFSHDFEYEDHTTEVTKLHFYGNDGVCLFKYFVNKDDPQKYFVWSILAANFICFLFISISYIIIAIVSKQSSKGLSQMPGNKQINTRNRRMNRKIATIIITDFFCWVPFIIICVLHSSETLDATPWYSLFSMIILPINSVINPFLYDDAVTSILCPHFYFIFDKVLSLYQNFLSYFHTTQPEVFQMEHITVQGKTPV